MTQKKQNTIYALKKSLFGLSALSVLLFPTVAKADQGVFIQDYQAKNGNVQQKFYDGEIVNIIETKENSYIIESDKGNFQIDKKSLLKTHVKKPSHYEPSDKKAIIYLDDSFLSVPLQEVKEGEPLYLTAEEKGDWIKVKTEIGIEGWVFEKDVTLKYKEVPTYQIGYIHKDVQIDGHSFNLGDKVRLSSYKDNHFNVVYKDQIYRVHEKYIGFDEPERRNAELLIQYGFKQLGKPYIFGANGPDAWDCSSFTQHTFRQIGIHLPRTALEQSKVGQYVEFSDMKRGDLVFFETYKKGASHVGIYLGNGKMLHAGTSYGVSVTDLNTDYWKERYLFSKRVLS